MAACVPRSRRLTEPFNEKIRERIFGISSSASTTSSSGSEHEADNDTVSISSSSHSPSPSPCLSDLVQNFLEETSDSQCGENEKDIFNNLINEDCNSDDGESCSPLSSDRVTSIIQEAIDPTTTRVRNNADRFRRDLRRQVSRAVESLSLFRRNKSAFNRSVMGYLREVGYDAALCKTKWDASSNGSLTAGSYEYIDVITADNGRYVVDLDFRGQFQIARETERYGEVIAAIPGLFVGRVEDLKRVLRVMADEMRRSMKSGGMCLPPWRKHRYLQAKWIGPYKRTTNQIPWMSAVTASPTGSVNMQVVKCRAVGFFGAAGDGGKMVVTSGVTKTR